MDKEPQVIDAEVVTEGKELTATAPNGHSPEALMPVMDIKQAVERYGQMTEFVSKIMKVGVDFGKIPGTGGKDVLLKPGAEKLTTFFGLTPRFVDERVVEDDSDPDNTFYFYRRKCQLYRGDRLVGEASGSCNSREAKYRWRNARRSCPDCGEELRISKRGNKEFYCWDKTGGCGAKFPPDDRRITEQELGKIENENIADLANTILKMADKRALVAVTLIACNASEFFTQDLEDMAANGDKPEPVKPAKTQPSNEVYWTRNPALVKAFKKYVTAEKTLEMVNAIDALNDATDYEVKILTDYKGSRNEAKVAIERWITRQLTGDKKEPVKKDILEMDAAGLKTLLSISASEFEHDPKFKIANRKHNEKICASRMKAALQGNDDKRKRLMHWLFGQTSFTEVSDAQLQGMWVYLGSVQEFGVGVDPRIAKELGAAYDAAITEGKEFGGFDDMPWEEDEEPEEVTA